MNSLRRRLSAMPVLNRIRLITVVFGVLATVALTGQLDTSRPGPEVGVALAAMATIALTMVLTYARGQVLVVDPLLPLLVVVFGAAVQDPRATTGVCVGIVVAQSFYGSTRRAAVRAGLLVPVLPLAVRFNPNADFGALDPSVLSLIPIFMIFTLLIRVLKGSLESQVETSAREALLAATSRRLLGCTDLDEVRSIVTRAGGELVTRTPGLVVLTVVRHGVRARVLRAYGVAEDLVGLSVPIEAAARGAGESLDGLVGGRRHWRVIELDHDVLGAVHGDTCEDGDLLLLGLDRRIPESVIDAFSSLSAQMSMAETACRAHAELEHRAHHDELTAMPNRAVVFHRLAVSLEEAAARGVTAAVMVIDLDDFKTVNDTYGHGGGDALLVEIARRMVEVVGKDGMAARFGGDEFAVLMPSTDRSAATRLAHALRARLLEPVAMGNAAVTVGCSIGLALSDGERTATDLVRCADIAMYAAKAGGKNRVEDFSEERHGAIAEQRIAQPTA
ncbi:diguanylate cyclase domain-containing protein [Spongisporangium articulatum]|uniref:Diguanylate cyclase domain-containing protein n=1 Tax=Spongisporangium articulatum TaxID=3362603 RepID=A0ABW8AV18_9ACTN